MQGRRLSTFYRYYPILHLIGLNKCVRFFVFRTLQTALTVNHNISQLVAEGEVDMSVLLIMRQYLLSLRRIIVLV